VLRQALGSAGSVVAVDTGQHYDYTLHQIHYDQLGVPPPDVHLGVGSASHGEQTAAILTAAERCDVVLLGSLLNLDAVCEAARSTGGDVVVYCAGFMGTFALDDAYCAGRIVERLSGDRSDAAVAAEWIAASFASPLEGLNARTYGPPGLEADIDFCARENLLETVPRFARMIAGAAEIVA